MKPISLVVHVVFLASTVMSVNARAVRSTQNVAFSQEVQIPDAVLRPGNYTFSVEDRLQDRAIVRITSADGKKHFLVLTVPDAKLQGESVEGLIFFSSVDSKKQALRGWKCPDCRIDLELVYPKAEAAKLTDESGQSVLAVDPSYDKLPANLSPDDLKVVTLWLLSPQRITAKNKGEGVSAEKYAEVGTPSEPIQRAGASLEPGSPAGTLRALSPASSSTELTNPPLGPIATAQPHRGLPKTASNTFSLAWSGLLLMAAGMILGALRHRRAEE